MTMFAKRVKFVRSMNAEVEILDRRIMREVSKLNDNIHQEIKKKLKKLVPGIQVRIQKIQIDDFIKNERQGTPLCVLVETLNGKKVHKDRVWVDDRPVVDHSRNQVTWIETDNRITIEAFENACRELSEDLGVELQIEKVSGRIE